MSCRRACVADTPRSGGRHFSDSALMPTKDLAKNSPSFVDTIAVKDSVKDIPVDNLRRQQGAMSFMRE